MNILNQSATSSELSTANKYAIAIVYIAITAELLS